MWRRVNRFLWRLWVISIALLLVLQFPLLAQDQSVEQEIADVAPTMVMLGGDPLFEVTTNLGSFSATNRAKIITERLATVADDRSIPIDSIHTETRNSDIYIVAGDETLVSIATISPEDAAALNTQPHLLAESRVRAIKEAIAQYRQERSLKYILRDIIFAIFTTLGLVLVFNILNRLYTLSTERLKNWLNVRTSNLSLAGMRAVSIAPFVDLILRFLELGRNILALALIGFYIFLIFSFFPWTQPLSENFWGVIGSSLRKIEQAILGYVPSLLILILIIFITREILAFVKLYFREIERGNISVPWLYPDWIRPTLHLTRFFILALAVSIGMPFLPGFQSPAFQGVSLVLSALFTFGAAGAVSNIVGGIIAVYTRGFQLGDMIKIGELMGIVTEKNLLVTRIRTPKNVVITIPNSTILGSNIINYSGLAKDTKDDIGLILHTTITLGYDVPWKKVHEALIQAALATPDILHNPAPFVLQTSLNDYHVSYELNAYTDYANKMPLIYSELHKNIQDYCNAAGIEILSPGYFAVRDGNHSTIPENYLPTDYLAPEFRVNSSSQNHQS